MKSFRADLHCHSSCSDGSCTPSELLHLAERSGLSGLSITDHDTIAAYTPALFQEAKDRSIALLPGIECSSDHQGVGVHILGYGMDLSSPSFHTFLDDVQQQRRERNRQIIARLAQHGFLFEEDEISWLLQENRGRPHIATLLVRKGYAVSRTEAFAQYLKEGGTCFVGGCRFRPERVIAEIHAAGGKAILAHPSLIRPFTLCRTLWSLPFDGIECYYAKLPPSQVRYWLNIAKDHHWIASGGSDFHGTLTPHLELGCSWIGESIFNACSLNLNC